MNVHEGHGAHCGDVCHLNETAQALYWDMRYADRHDDAERFRTTVVV